MSERLGSIQDEWCVADGWLGDDPRFDGWYVVMGGNDDAYAGPFTEDEAMRMLPILRARYGGDR